MLRHDGPILDTVDRMLGRRLVGLVALAATGGALLPLVVVSPAAAATITVTTTADVIDGSDGLTSLREAMTTANVTPGDNTIVLAAATYPLSICDGSGEENLGASGDLDQVGSAGRLTIDGHGATIEQQCGLNSGDRVLEGRSLAGLELVDVTVRGGDVALLGLRGGGVFAAGPTVLTNVDFENNRAHVGGGFAQFRFADSLALTVTGGSFVENEAVQSGGGLSAEADDVSSVVAIDGTSFVDNDVTGATTGSRPGGGGIAIVAGAVSVEGVVVEGNAVTEATPGVSRGAGIAITMSFDGGSPTITSSTIEENTGTTLGGGIYMQQSNSGSCAPLVVGLTTVRANEAGIGAGIDAQCLTLQSSTVADNTASVSAGGISTVAGGSVDSADVRILASTISGNTAPMDAGVLVATNSPSIGHVIDSSTISGNHTTVGGSTAIRIDEPAVLDAPVAVESSTITGNDGPAAALVSETDLDVAGTVIAAAGAACAATGTGTITSGGDNLATDATCNLVDPTDHPSTDPMLNPLDDYGGPTETHLPLPDSPVVDGAPGGCPPTDQRGVVRPQGAGCDIGSVEAQPSELGVLVVTTTNDVVDAGDGVLSLREAIHLANVQAGPDQIVLGSGVSYELSIPGIDEDANATGDLDSSGDLSIAGNGATIDAGGLDRALEATASLTISDLTVTGGDTTAGSTTRDGGGVRVNSEQSAVRVHLASVHLVDNVSSGDGGGLAVRLTETDSSVTVSDSAIEGNRTAILGGGLILTGDATVDVQGTSIDHNMVDQALAPFPNSGSGGGGMFLESAGRVLDSSVSHNVISPPANGFGGGIGFDHSAGVELARVQLVGNTGAGAGGGIGGDDTPLSISESLVADNTAEAFGGGVWAAGALTLSESTIVGNQLVDVDSYGGGLGAEVAHISDSTIADNQGGRGGGLLVSALEMSGTTISGNRAVGTGGGIGVGSTFETATPHIARSTISGNTAEDGAGAIATQVGLAPPRPVELVEVTIADNSGTVDGIAATAAVDMERTVIAGDGSGPVCSGVAFIESLGHNASTGSCGLDEPTDLTFIQPSLGPLADNGGPTSTRRPLPGSPLLDAGGNECAAVDQRGVARPIALACDIGAVEADIVTATFSDVPTTHPFSAEIECLVDLDVTTGFADGTFRPGATITRQAAVAWLWRLAGAPTPAGDPPFSDVPPPHPFADAIAWAAEEGITTGLLDGTFRPGLNVQRQALAVWLWRAAEEPPPADAPPFSDVSPSHPFAEAIGWLAEVGITEGYADGTFHPGLSITRQAVAAWVCRADAHGALS